MTDFVKFCQGNEGQRQCKGRQCVTISNFPDFLSLARFSWLYWNEISYLSRNNRNNTSSLIFKYLFLFLSNFLYCEPCNILPHTSRPSNWYIRNFLLVCKFQADKNPTSLLMTFSKYTNRREEILPPVCPDGWASLKNVRSCVASLCDLSDCEICI